VELTREETTERLCRFLAERTGARTARVTALTPLSGGAIQENWRVDAELDGGQLDGHQSMVLRMDAPSRVEFSLTRAQEFQLLKAAFAAGVTVPEPLLLAEDGGPLGRPFYLMRRAEGIAAGYKLVRAGMDEAAREALVERLGEELALVHAIRPPRPDLAFLALPRKPVAVERIERYRRCLDGLSSAHPALEWGLRWLELNRRSQGPIVLCHADFRTGNYLVHEGQLTGILDWEFAWWGEPLEDIAWFCARCWRFGAVEREAGGIGSRAAFYRGYERVAGASIQAAGVGWWEVMAAVRWAIIALQQAGRRTGDRTRALELALTAHIVPELELDILTQIDRATAEAAA
jgi:aminoglycoside phosphotransferase (APT) family kinase protein